jgi:hypothetical protein
MSTSDGIVEETQSVE